MFIVKCTIARIFTLVNNFLTKNIKYLTFCVFTVFLSSLVVYLAYHYLIMKDMVETCCVNGGI